MAASSLILDYLGVGVASGRPTSLTLATGALGLYFATDTSVLSLWNGSAWTSATAGTLPSIADGDLLANISGSSAAPIANTLTGLIDHVLGGTEGDILYRGATVWTALAPGTVGQVLATGGTGAIPAWGSAGYGGLPTELGNVPITLGFSGLPGAGQQFVVPLTQALTLPTNLAGTTGYALTGSTASAAFNLSYIRSGTTTSIATLTFAIGAHTLSSITATALSLLATDVLLLTAPATQDATLATVSLSFLAGRV